MSERNQRMTQAELDALIEEVNAMTAEQVQAALESSGVTPGAVERFNAANNGEEVRYDLIYITLLQKRYNEIVIAATDNIPSDVGARLGALESTAWTKRPALGTNPETDPDTGEIIDTHVTDLNEVFDTGFYALYGTRYFCCGFDGEGDPIPTPLENRAGVLFVYESSGTYYQMLIGAKAGTTMGETYFRAYYNSNWQNWSENTAWKSNRALADGTDINGVTVPGSYAMHSGRHYTCGGNETPVDGKAGLLRVYASSSTIYQMITGSEDDNMGETYFRAKYSDGWRDFAQVGTGADYTIIENQDWED